MKDNQSNVAVLYYDGITNTAYSAQLSAHQDGVVVRYLDQYKLYLREDLTYIGAIGKIMPAIELPEDARIEFLSQEVPQWLEMKNKKLWQFFHHMEGSWRWIAVSFVAVLAIVISTFKWGIPTASYHIAQHLPESTLLKVGDQAESMLMSMTEETELSLQRQNQIKALYSKNIVSEHPAKIVFRKGGENMSANALAIPNGTIMLTDELIALAKNDNELLGVLAHEQGHLDEKHSLQQALSGIGMSVLYIAVTGDASDIVGGLPLAIAASSYSQNFELEADQRAIDDLKRLNISPIHMANFLKRLTESYELDPNASDFLESHPSTARRVAQIEAQIDK